jgi:hypothetical protein
LASVVDPGLLSPDVIQHVLVHPEENGGLDHEVDEVDDLNPHLVNVLRPPHVGLVNVLATNLLGPALPRNPVSEFGGFLRNAGGDLINLGGEASSVLGREDQAIEVLA